MGQGDSDEELYRKGGDMNSGAIWTYDMYDWRKFYPDKIDYLLDIGGCVGTASVFFKSICPRAEVIAIEPCKENYELMNVAAGTWDVRCYNMALGNGEDLCFGRSASSKGHRFYTDTEKQWWPEDPEYFVESRTLSQLFKHFKIKGRYIIKVDAEGGERFIFDDKDCIEIVRNSAQFNIELHKGFGGDRELWRDWFALFKDTHRLVHRTIERDGAKSCFEDVETPNTRWRGEYILLRREHDGI